MNVLSLYLLSKRQVRDCVTSGPINFSTICHFHADQTPWKTCVAGKRKSNILVFYMWTSQRTVLMNLVECKWKITTKVLHTRIDYSSVQKPGTVFQSPVVHFDFVDFVYFVKTLIHLFCMWKLDSVAYENISLLSSVKVIM